MRQTISNKQINKSIETLTFRSFVPFFQSLVTVVSDINYYMKLIFFEIKSNTFQNFILSKYTLNPKMKPFIRICFICLESISYLNSENKVDGLIKDYVNFYLENQFKDYKQKFIL